MAELQLALGHEKLLYETAVSTEDGKETMRYSGKLTRRARFTDSGSRPTSSTRVRKDVSISTASGFSSPARHVEEAQMGPREQ